MNNLPSNHKEIKQLIETNPFDLNTIQKLEQYVNDQYQNNTYDYQSNKELLKCYQFYAQNANTEIICKILILSLMRLPSSDYLSLLYLINKQNNDSKFLLIIKSGEFLENGKLMISFDYLF